MRISDCSSEVCSSDLGHPERLRLNNPPEVVETEHRLTIGLPARGITDRTLGDIAELTFAARASASFPGAFTPYTVRAVYEVLEQRTHMWPTWDTYMTNNYTRSAALRHTQYSFPIDVSV